MTPGKRFRLQESDDAVVYLTFYEVDLNDDGAPDHLAQSVTHGVPPHWIVVLSCGEKVGVLWTGPAEHLAPAATSTTAGERRWRDILLADKGRDVTLRFDGTAYR